MWLQLWGATGGTGELSVWALLWGSTPVWGALQEPTFGVSPTLVVAWLGRAWVRFTPCNPSKGGGVAQTPKKKGVIPSPALTGELGSLAHPKMPGQEAALSPPLQE